ATGRQPFRSRAKDYHRRYGIYDRRGCAKRLLWHDRRLRARSLDLDGDGKAVASRTLGWPHQRELPGPLPHRPSQARCDGATGERRGQPAFHAIIARTRGRATYGATSQADSGSEYSTDTNESWSFITA